MYDVVNKCLSYLDLISMDVKAPLNKEIYSTICGIDEKAAESAIESIKKILNDERLFLRLEVKTTIYKEFVGLLSDIKKDIPEGIDWIIQKGYVEKIPPQQTRMSASRERFDIVTELKEDDIKKLAEDLAGNRKNIWIRTESGDKKIS